MSALLKLFIAPVTGLSVSLAFLGISPDIFTKAQRQFKWLLNWGDNQATQGLAQIKESNKYFVSSSAHKWQGLYTDKEIEKLFAGQDRGSKNIYKLFFKSEVIQQEGEIKNGKGIKGSIGLVKISSEKTGGDSKVKIEEITKEEEKNVWLIIAKGKKSIYLMPTVRSKESSDVRSKQATKEEKEIWVGGVDVASWKDNKQSKEWDIAEDKKIQESLKEGFVIVRAGENVLEGGQQRAKDLAEKDFEFWLQMKQIPMMSSVAMMVEDNLLGNFYYQNAGMVLGRKKISKDFGGFSMEMEKWNDSREKFFPLDIQVMGDSQVLKNKQKGKKQLTQEIEIDDEITKVVGVRLDQVVISETGIGVGVEREIKWGDLKRPTWTSELIK